MPDVGAATVVSVADVPWENVQRVFGTRGYPSRCWCQFFKPPRPGWQWGTLEECSALLHEQVRVSDPAPAVIAYLDGEPVGWCAIEPRPHYDRLRRTKVVTEGSAEDPDDASAYRWFRDGSCRSRPIGGGPKTFMVFP